MSEYPASSFRVASRRNANSSLSLDGTSGNVSEVVRLFAPKDVKTIGARYSFILMELKQPLNLMPVCVDWTGSAQLQNQRVGTASPQGVNSTPFQHTLIPKHVRNWSNLVRRLLP